MTDKRIRSGTQWRTMHVVVSVPVLGHLSDTRLNMLLEKVLNEEIENIIGLDVKRGRFRAKALSRVLSAAKRRDRQPAEKPPEIARPLTKEEESFFRANGIIV